MNLAVLVAQVPALPPLTSLVIIMHKNRKYFPNKQKLQHKA
jgi:hypothetical protein